MVLTHIAVKNTNIYLGGMHEIYCANGVSRLGNVSLIYH